MSDRAAWQLLKGKLLSVWLPVAVIILVAVLATR